MKEEVLKLESSNYSFLLTDFRLKKLYEHINELLKKGNDKDEQQLSALNNQIEQAVSYQIINYNSIVSLKKILTGVQVKSLYNQDCVNSFKGSISSLILYERAKVILTQKIKILREDLQKKYETINANKTKSGNLKDTFQEEEKLSENKNSKGEKVPKTKNSNKSIDKASSTLKTLNTSKKKQSVLLSSSDLNNSKPGGFNLETEEEEKITIVRNLVDINSDVEQSVPFR